MYTPAVFEVGDRLLYGQENLVAVVLDPAPFEQPQVGYTSKVRTHKARMNYWWDFCPRMLHQGIWDKVFLDVAGPVRIEELSLRTQLSDDNHQGELEVAVDISSLEARPAWVEASMLLGDESLGVQRIQTGLDKGSSRITCKIPVENPRLWWPNGYGEQPLYQVTVRVGTQENPAEESDRREARTGFRTVRFLPNPGASPEARPYMLSVNGRRIYIKGWNWVPMDVLYGLERPEKLGRLLGLATAAHINLLRVWGGGLLEKDSFYDLCDELGILVWQEFIQSSSGIDNHPPDEPGFIAWMEAEARKIVPRRRNHTCLAVWCGGNELQGPGSSPLDESTSPMLAMLRRVVEELDPGRAWLPTSPTGPFFGYSRESGQDPRSLHDVHGPWHHQGVNSHQELYNQGSSLLHSEFGVEGITNQKTLDGMIPAANQMPVSLDNPYWFHLGAWWVREKVWRSVFGELQSAAEAVCALQFLQADGLRYGLEADRRRKYHNSGTLPWQFNEPYPMAACTSAVDYYTRPKPAYYAVAAGYEPVHVSASFPAQAWAGRETFTSQVWVSNSQLEEIESTVLETAITGAGGEIFYTDRQVRYIPGDASTLIQEITWDFSGLDEDLFFLSLRLSSAAGLALTENRYVFTRTENLAPLLRLPSTEIQVEKRAESDRWELALHNKGPQAALFLFLEDERPLRSTGYLWLDHNYFCLLPGESRQVHARWEGVPPSDRKISIGGLNIGPRIGLN
jgi:beta-mannosidase